ncbi:MAG: hypothetical protein Tsb0010_08280 [Parvularculaceae bacterium]
MDIVLNFAAWHAPILAAALLLAAARATELRIGWLFAAILANAAYVALNFTGRDFIPLARWFGDLGWNWEGKIAAIGGTLAAVILLRLLFRRASFGTMGFRARQAPGSIAPALIATMIGVGSAIGLEILAADGRSLDPERLLYQATMPGLDEEPYYRGLLLGLMMLALPGRNEKQGANILGARIGWAGLLVTLLFGLMHGVAVAEGALVVSWAAIAITGYLGFILLWIRMRTGSVLLPILAHNMMNFANSFF